MKKSLVALAALAATSAFAQSSVTLSGNLDFAAGSVSGNAKGATVATSTVTSSTSVINLVAEEKITGGLTVTAKYGIDPRKLADDNGLISTTSAAGTNNSFNRDEVFVGIQGGFGNIRLGSPNSIGLNTFQIASPLGTGIGSGYASTAGDHSNVRYDRSARYDSPSVNGLTVSLLYAPGADRATTAKVFENNNEVTEVGLRYAAGPLTLGFANVSQAYQTNASTALATNIPAGSVKTSSNILAASYQFGSTTLYAGWNDGDAKARATTTSTSKGYRAGLRHDVGAISLLASYAEQQTQGSSSTPKETVTGLRADYNLSKTAAAYLGYERYDTGTTYANSTTTGTRTTVSVGLRKSF